MVRRWAERRPDVCGVALVGSYARGAATPDSDVDLVVLTETPAPYIDADDWARELGAEGVTRTRHWGVLTERRLRMQGGLELDVGIVLPSWASTDPIDPGTAHVVADGLAPLHDPQGLLAQLNQQGPSPRP